MSSLYSSNLLSAISSECKRLFKVDDVEIIWVEGDIRPNEPNLWGIYTWWNKQIKIKIRPDLLSMLETLCHEIVHHIQYRNGELFFGRYESGKRISIYKGVEYTLCDRPMSKNEVTYWNAPWEVDARKYQTRLFDHFASKASISLVKAIREIVSRRVA